MNDRKVEIVVTITTASPATCTVGWGQWRDHHNGWQFSSPPPTKAVSLLKPWLELEL